MIICLVKDGGNYLKKTDSDGVVSSTEIDTANYPVLLEVLTNLAVNVSEDSRTSGLDVLDKYSGYTAVLENSSITELLIDKGRQATYNSSMDWEGCLVLGELEKAEIDNLASLL